MNSQATTANPDTANKACPFCGEQILAVALKCKHCGSSLADSSSAAASAVKKQFKLRPTFAVLLVIVVGVIAAGWIANLSRTGTLSGKGFTDADVTSIERDIRTELGKRGGAVEDVKLIKESPRKLTGFAKVKVPLLGVLNKSCTATMADDGQVIWRCE